MQKLLSPRIFREYDIRGIVDESLFPENAYEIGRAYGSVVREKSNTAKVAVGYDGRISSPALQQALTKGLQEVGCDVIAVGLCPTPMLYFTVASENLAGGIMVTGSHNPPAHNGFKFMLGRKSFFGSAIQDLRKRIEAGKFSQGKGSVTPIAIKEKYLQALLAAAPSASNLKIAWDAGNGATGEILEALANRLPGTHILLNTTIDGAFPAHHPDPTVPENLDQLISTVKEEHCDFGIAFDGDGDRIGVVDDEGMILWGDQLLALYAAEIVKDKPGATIIADVKASQALFDEVTRIGGTPLMWKTGHSHIKSKMAEIGAPLAGEMSGHIFFADRYYGFDDALYAAVRMLTLVQNAGVKLSDLRKALPVKINTPEIRFDCDDAEKFSIIDKIKSQLQKEKIDFNDVDGMRVQTPVGWWLLRASNTQAMLVARCESENQDGLEKLKASLSHYLRPHGIDVPF